MINEEMLSGLVSHFNGTVEIQPREKIIDGTPKRKSRPQSSRRRHGRPPASGSEKIIAAKDDAMRRFGVSEPVIHRLIQNLSMECRITFEDAADIIRLGCLSLDYLKANPDGDPEE